MCIEPLSNFINVKSLFYLTFDRMSPPLYAQRDMKQNFYLTKNDNELTDRESDRKSKRPNVYVDEAEGLLLINQPQVVVYFLINIFGDI